MRLLFVLIFIAGCGSGGDEPTNPNHGYGFAYDVQGPSGLKLRYTPVLPSAEVTSYESEFASVEQCTAMSAPAPFVIVVNPGTLGLGDFGVQVNGDYFSNPSLLVVDTTLAALRHEMIHYLLEKTTGDPDGSHKSKLFKVVADGGCA